MRQLLVGLFTLLLLCSTTAIAETKKAAKEQPLDGVVAIVNNGVITKTELNREVKKIKRELKRRQAKVPLDPILRKQVLQRLVDIKLQLELAQERGIKVDNAQLNEAIRQVAKRNKISLAKLREEIEKEGTKYKDYREDFRKEMILAQLHRQAVNPQVDDRRINRYLKAFRTQAQAHTEYHLKDILIPLPEVPTSTEVQMTKDQAQRLLKRLRGGLDFSQAAVEESGSQNALEGGDLGWRKLAEIPEVFAQKIVKMKNGEIVGPIRTANGFHLIKLVASRNTAKKHFVTKTHARHILIKTGKITSDEQAKTQLLALRKEIQQGEKFETVAKKHSQDLVSAAKGGDLGWRQPGELVPDFEKAMKKLKPGQMSQPIKTKFGWHLIKVIARKKVDDTKDFEKQQVRKMLTARKFEQEIQDWVQKLRGHAFVKYVA